MLRSTRALEDAKCETIAMEDTRNMVRFGLRRDVGGSACEGAQHALIDITLQLTNLEMALRNFGKSFYSW